MREIVDQGLDPRETIRQLAVSLVTDRARNGIRFRLIDHSEWAMPAELAEAFLVGRRETLELIIGVIEAGVATGWFHSDDARVSALSVLGMCNWVAWWFESGPDHPVEPVARQISDAAVALLTSRYAQENGPPAVDAGEVITDIEQQLHRLRKFISPPI